jgi:hypothetical protein
MAAKCEKCERSAHPTPCAGLYWRCAAESSHQGVFNGAVEIWRQLHGHQGVPFRRVWVVGPGINGGFLAQQGAAEAAVGVAAKCRVGLQGHTSKYRLMASAWSAADADCRLSGGHT